MTGETSHADEFPGSRAQESRGTSLATAQGETLKNGFVMHFYVVPTVGLALVLEQP